MTIEQATTSMNIPQNNPTSLTITGQSRETRQDTHLPMLLYLVETPKKLSANRNPLERLEYLEALADNVWRPSTSELASLLGVMSLSDKDFERYGFRYSRTERNDIQSAWKVEQV